MTISTFAGSDPGVTRGVVRWAVRETMGILMAGAILFLCAGRWDWIWGWATVAALAFWVGATALAVIPKHPAVPAERRDPRKGAKVWDTALMSVVGAIVLAVYLVSGLDARYDWTAGFSTPAQVAGAILAFLGCSLFVWAIASNAFFSQNDNLLPPIKTEVRGGKLVINFEPHKVTTHLTDLAFRLTVKDLNSIDLNGAVALQGSGIDTSKLNVSVSGAATVNLAGQAEQLAVTMDGAGAYNSENLQSKRATVANNGAGLAVVRVSDELDATVDGIGVKYIGNPRVSRGVHGLGVISRY